MPAMMDVVVDTMRFAGMFLVEARHAFVPPKRSGFSKMDKKALNFLRN